MIWKMIPPIFLKNVIKKSFSICLVLARRYWEFEMKYFLLSRLYFSLAFFRAPQTVPQINHWHPAVVSRLHIFTPPWLIIRFLFVRTHFESARKKKEHAINRIRNTLADKSSLHQHDHWRYILEQKPGQVLDIADSSSQRSQCVGAKILMNALSLSDLCTDRSTIYKNIWNYNFCNRWTRLIFAARSSIISQSMSECEWKR